LAFDKIVFFNDWRDAEYVAEKESVKKAKSNSEKDVSARIWAATKILVTKINLKKLKNATKKA
jgi:hypothetical protein